MAGHRTRTGTIGRGRRAVVAPRPTAVGSRAQRRSAVKRAPVGLARHKARRLGGQVSTKVTLSIALVMISATAAFA